LIDLPSWKEHMNMTSDSLRAHTARDLAVLLALVVSLAVIGVARADDKKPKPQPAQTENISLNFAKFHTEYSNGASGPSVSVTGDLHLVSQALLSASGAPYAFLLHTDISDTTASSEDGAQSFVAVGASAMPAECASEPCPPPFWTVTFRLVPKGASLQSSLFFDLTLKTQYDAYGRLTDACISGQPDCDVVFAPPPSLQP